MTPVILTPILFAEADVVTAGALFLIGLGIGAVVMYFVGLSARSRYQSATQQLANLQGQNLKQRAATVGIPQGEAPNAPLPPRKTGLPPKKEKPKDEAATSEDLQQLQSQIESLNDQNATLLLQVEAEQQQRALELHRIAELERSIASQATTPPTATETSSEQQWQLDQLHRENVALQSTVDQYRDQIEQLQSNADSPPAQISDSALEAEIEQLRQQVQQLDEVQTQADRLAEKLYASEEMLREAQLHVEQSDQASSHLQVQIAEYQANIKSLEAKIASMPEAAPAANDSLDELRSILAQSEAAVASLEREKLDYKTQLDELREQQNADAALLAETSEATKDENEANKQMIAQLKQELAQRDEQLLAVQKGMNDLYTARDRVVTLEIANAERNATVERLEGELAQARAATEQAIRKAASSEQPTVDPAIVNELKTELEAKNTALDAANAANFDLQTALQSAQESLEEEKTREPDSAPAEVAELQEELERTQAELEAHQARVADDQKQFEQLKTELRMRDEQAQASQDEVKKLRLENERIAVELDAERNHTPPQTLQEIDLLRSELSRQEDEKTASALRFAELTQTITQLTNELEKERTNTPPPVAHQMGALQRDLEQRNTLVDRANSELNELRSALHQLQAERDEVEQERNSAKAEIRKLQKKSSAADEIQQELAAALEERDLLKGNEDSLSTRVTELETKLRDAARERDAAARLASDLREQVDGSPTAHAELAALQQQVMSLISDKEKERELREEAQYRAEDLEAELAELKSGSSNSSNDELDDAKLEIEQLKATCLKYQADAEGHARTASGQKSQLAELQATVELFDSVKQELKGQIVGLTEQTRQLEKDVDARDERLAILSSQAENSADRATRLAEVERQLDESNTRRIQLQSAIEEAQQKIEELSEAAQEAGSFEAANATIAELKKRLKTERASLEQGIQQRDRQIQFLTSDRDELKKNAELALEQSRQQLGPLKEKTDELVAAIAQARTERQSMSGKLAAEQSACAHLKDELDEAKAELASQLAANEELSEQAADSKELSAKLAQAESNAQSTREKLQAAIGKIGELELSLEEQRDKEKDSVNDNNVNNNDSIDDGKSAERIEELENQVEEFEEENILLVAEMRQLREQAEAFEKQMLEAQAETQRVIKEARGNTQEEDPAADTKKGKLKRQVKELEAELSSTKEELFKQSETANAWRKERSDLLNQVESLTREVAEREHGGDETGENDVDDGEDITDEYMTLVKQHDELAAELGRTEQTLQGKDDRIDELASALAESRRKISSLKSELTESQAVIRSQTRGTAQKSVGTAAPKPSEKAKPSAARSLQSVTQNRADDNDPKGSKKSKSKKTKQPTKKHTKKLSKKKKTSKKRVEPFDDPEIGPVFRLPPTERDDLRNIKGLGPKFQDKLNELGIYRYSQVAKWTSKISAEIADRIGAGPRIKNEKWVQQAKQLSKKSSKR